MSIKTEKKENLRMSQFLLITYGCCWTVIIRFSSYFSVKRQNKCRTNKFEFNKLLFSFFSSTLLLSIHEISHCFFSSFSRISKINIIQIQIIILQKKKPNFIFQLQKTNLLLDCYSIVPYFSCYFLYKQLILGSTLRTVHSMLHSLE